MVEIESTALLRELAAIEQIKKVKYRYWRIMDQNLSDQIGDVFTDDAVCDYGSELGVIKGREAIVEFFHESVYPAFGMMAHFGHNPEIYLTSETTGEGTWSYESYKLAASPLTGWWKAGIYEDEYRCVEGEWKISLTKGYAYFFDTPIENLWVRERFRP